MRSPGGRSPGASDASPAAPGGCAAGISLQRCGLNRTRARIMKYGIDFRFLPKGAAKPVENTSYSRPVDVEVDDTQYGLVPEVGDFVHLQGEEGFRNIPILGRVKSRFFEYQLS